MPTFNALLSVNGELAYLASRSGSEEGARCRLSLFHICALYATPRLLATITAVHIHLSKHPIHSDQYNSHNLRFHLNTIPCD